MGGPRDRWGCLPTAHFIIINQLRSPFTVWMKLCHSFDRHRHWQDISRIETSVQIHYVRYAKVWQRLDASAIPT